MLRLAVFDFDGTIFAGETLPFLLSQWKDLKYPRSQLAATYLSTLPLYITYKMGLSKRLTREEMRTRAVKKVNHLFKGMTEAAINNFFAQVYANMVSSFDSRVVQETKSAKQSGFHLVILSGAYSPLLHLLAEDLGFDTVIGTEMHFRDGLFDHQAGIEVVSGQLKVQRLQERFSETSVDWNNSIAYGDSASDLPLLEIVGQPVAVNPDKVLSEAAAVNRWKVIA